jgi:ABC-type phosphate transport system substrate-binding protein
LKKLLLLISILLLPVQSGAGELYIAANAMVSESGLTKSEIKDIYTGKKTTWNDGTKIIFTLLSDKSVTNPFIKEYINMSPAAYKRMLNKKIYTSGFRKPEYINSEKQLIEFLAENKGTVGFLTAKPGEWGTWQVKPVVVE